MARSAAANVNPEEMEEGVFCRLSRIRVRSSGFWGRVLLLLLFSYEQKGDVGCTRVK